MPISGRCQWCGATYQADASQSGDLIECPACGSRTRVADAPDAPAERTRSPAVEVFRTRLKEERYGRGEPVNRGLDEPEEDLGEALGRAAGTGAKLLFRGLALIVIGFLLWNLWGVKRGQAPPAPPAAARPAVVPPALAPPERDAKPARRGAAPNELQQPVAANQPPPGMRRAVAPPAEAPDPPVPWSVVIDLSLDDGVVAADQVIQIPIPEGPSPEIVFPATPGTVICVGNVGNGREYREFWDLRTNEKLGSTRGLKTMYENLDGYHRPMSTISPDGRHFVTQGMRPLELVVWDVHAAELRGVLPLKHEPTAGLTWAAFAGREAVAACGAGVPMQVLGVPASLSKEVARFPNEREYDRHALALSPGGRYLAVIHNLGNEKVIKVFDLRSAAAAGQIAVPKTDPSGNRVTGSLMFSADGIELAGLFEGPFASQLLCWSLADGALVEQIDFGGNVRGIMQAPAYVHAPLDWFPGRQRWLVCGQGIVDRASRKLAGIIPEDPSHKPGAIRRVVSANGVVGVVKDGTRYALGNIKLPEQTP
jgi:hypothetical protein